MYMESYNNRNNTGYRFSLEKIENGKRTWFLNSDRIQWDTLLNKWTIQNYYVRTINGFHEHIVSGMRKDTTFKIKPADFKRRLNIIEAMDNSELNRFIREEESQGSENVTAYLVEAYRRIALPFSTFILMLIGVSLSSKKIRGGIGAQLGVGITLSFAYILFMQISNTFAIKPSSATRWMTLPSPSCHRRKRVKTSSQEHSVFRQTSKVRLTAELKVAPQPLQILLLRMHPLVEPRSSPPGLRFWIS